jgi:hypothetical protein
MRFGAIILFGFFISLTACVAKSTGLKSSGNGLSESISKIITGKHDRMDELMAFIENYSNLAPDAQKKVFSTTNQALAENKSNIVLRTKLAIMLALPTSRLRDPSKAQNLLQDLLREDNLEAQENALLGLLYEYAQDDTKLQQRARDDSKKLDLSQQKIDALQQKNDALEQKLNELKNIEKTMTERSKQ